MIPYIQVPDLHLGPLPLHPFGILVATGVLIGTSITTRRAKTLGYDVEQLNSFVTWMLVSAFAISHVLDSLFYHWDDVVARPWSLLLLWTGLSSFGGFVGALVGVILWKYFLIDDGKLRRRAHPVSILPFADLVCSVFPIGWAFGRAGCSTVHDHPGARTTADTLLAVAYPLHAGDGAVTKIGFIELIHGNDPRFDLGLLELLFTIVVATCFALTWKRRLPTGTYLAVAALAYAPVRFVMDFLRVPEIQGGDTRYSNLTPAQWACIVLFVFGIVMVGYLRRTRASGVDLASGLRVVGGPPALTPEGPPRA